MSTKEQIYKLPDLSMNSNTKVSYLINKAEYIFRYLWCDSFCLLDVYVVRNNNKIYLLKGRPVTINSNLIGRVKDSGLISGSLRIMNKYDDNIEPTQENFHKDFYLVYQEDKL